jgi:hypothetical protein
MHRQFRGHPANSATSTPRAFALTAVGASFLGICVLFVLAFTSFRPDRQSLSDRYFPSATATVTSTRTPTFTPVPTSTPRPTRTSTATPTLTLPPHVLITPAGGASVFAEAFDSDERDWYPFFSHNTVQVEAGRLTLRSEVSDNIGIAFCTDCPDLLDPFYFQAEVSTMEDTIEPYGLAFCSAGFGPDFYVFQINPRTHLYDLYKHSARGWKALNTVNFSPAINSVPHTNILGVQFEHGLINLFINNVPVSSYQDDDPFECRKSGFIVNGGGYDMVADNVFAYTTDSTLTSSP